MNSDALASKHERQEVAAKDFAAMAWKIPVPTWVMKKAEHG